MEIKPLSGSKIVLNVDEIDTLQKTILILDEIRKELCQTNSHLICSGNGEKKYYDHFELDDIRFALDLIKTKRLLTEED